MKIKTLSLVVLFSTLFSACSSYVNSIYRDFEQQERQNSEVDIPTDNFDQFRHPKRKTSREYNRLDRTITTSNAKYISPGIKRQYKPEKEVARRYTASDLTDKDNGGSLWAGNDPNAFLFSNSKSKNSGDIIQINVLPRLKNEITMELKKNFPDNPFDPKAKAEAAKGGDGKTPASTDKPAPEKQEIAAEPAAIPGDNSQDKISGVVVEEINREHLLIKGRKNVLFKNRKRMVEIQALVSRKDIGENDTLNSDAIIESSVSVVR